MSTYDIVCHVVRLLPVEGAAPTVLKEPDPLPTAKANGLCLPYSKRFIFSFTTSKRVSETLSLWCSRTLKKKLWLLSIGITPDQPIVHTSSGSVREPHSRFQRQGPADLQPFRHGEKYIRCRIRYSIRYRIQYHILYIVYDIVCDINTYDTVYDIVYDIV